MGLQREGGSGRGVLTAGVAPPKSDGPSVTVHHQLELNKKAPWQ